MTRRSLKSIRQEEAVRAFFRLGGVDSHAVASDPVTRNIVLGRVAKTLEEIYELAGIPQIDRERTIDQITHSVLVEDKIKFPINQELASIIKQQLLRV